MQTRAPADRRGGRPDRDRDEGGEGNCASRRLTPILVGGLGAAAIGALIARRYDRWDPLYP